jgi:hypothetical protein
MTAEEYRVSAKKAKEYAELQTQIDECEQALKKTDSLRTKSYSANRPWLTFGDGWSNGETVGIPVAIKDIVLNIVRAHMIDKITNLKKKQRLI